jgi:hypothetical protein
MQTIDEQIAAKLSEYGIVDFPEIEPEGKEMVLSALSQSDIYRVFVDKEGGLVVEYNEEE